MEFLEYISRYKTARGSVGRGYSAKTIFNALVVLGAIVLLDQLITTNIPKKFVQSTVIGPGDSWPTVSLDGRPDNLAIDDHDGSVFLAIDGDVYKYSDNLSLLISTRSSLQRSSPPLSPINATSQYVNKIFKIIRFGNPDLLLSCWQNQNFTLKCVFYRLDDLKFVPLTWSSASNNVTIFKTDFSEEIQVISSSHDANNLLIITSRPMSSEEQLENVIDFRSVASNSFKSFGMPVMGVFRVTKNLNTKHISLDLTSVLPYSKQLNDYLLFYHYVYAFNYEGYSYFILNDLRKSKSVDSEIVNTVRLARICRNDTELYSYTEISITCGNQYGLYAKTAYLALTRASGDQQLYVVVEKTSGDTHKKSNAAKSYLCSYSIKLIQDVFQKAISDCHEGLLSATMLDKLHPESKQVPICQKNPSRDWCTSATNPFIGGYSNHHIVKEDTCIELDGLTSANFFYATLQGYPDLKQVYFIGTEFGLLTKIGADEDLFYTVDLYDRQVRNYNIGGEKLSKIFANDTIKSRKGAKYSVANDYIFVTTDRSEIQKLPINGCQFYTSCDSCLTTRDPLQCVWCGDRCSSKIECSTYKQSTTLCPPLIKHVVPLSGPLTGGTRLTILGESFGSGKNSLKVTVANQECVIDQKSRENNKIECILKAVDREISSPIQIDVDDDTGYITLRGTTISSEPYHYRKVLINCSQPGYIVRNNNSVITVYGKNLDVGAERRIFFDDIECNVIQVQSDKLYCKVKSLDHVAQGFKGYLKVLIDGIEQEYKVVSSNTTNLNANNDCSRSLELQEDDNLVSDHSVSQPDNDNRLGSASLIMTFLLFITFIIFFVYLTRYDGFSQLTALIKPNNLNAKSDLEAAKLNFRNQNGDRLMHSDMTGRPSESLSGLIKLNDMTSDYFSKSEKNDQDKPLMHNLVDDEMMSILKQEKILIDRNRLTLGHVLGSGQFGRVYKGLLKVDNASEHITVAVKTLHNRCHWEDSDNNQAFLEEGLMMKDFAHENVLALIGVTFDSNGLPMVITPFMLYGDLRSYISDEASSPTVKELIEFGIQVAKGMAYLSSLKFVHRDLAARNCMLDDNLTVKVADFGLSRDIYERDYYSSDNKKAKLPVKWMAIESLEKSVYSTKTDVWSYGVLLWELMTRGVVPYPDVDNFDLFSYLKEGRRMLRPRFCPVNLYRIMQACWNANPDERPTFDELVVSVSNVITQLQEAKDSDGQQKVCRDETYCDLVR
jgi:hypothetical protein